MKGAATMGDVARGAEVTISTVSHVVNGTRFVSEATRTAVESFDRLEPTAIRGTHLRLKGMRENIE